MLQEIRREVAFMVKCMDSSGTTTLTKNRKYLVKKIGFNGWYKIIGDTKRFVWHNPNRFKELG